MHRHADLQFSKNTYDLCGILPSMRIKFISAFQPPPFVCFRIRPGSGSSCQGSHASGSLGFSETTGVPEAPLDEFRPAFQRQLAAMMARLRLREAKLVAAATSRPASLSWLPESR